MTSVQVAEGSGEHRAVQTVALAALRESTPVAGLLAGVAPWHRPGAFTPDVALLELAGDALGLACLRPGQVLAYEGLRERYLPEVPFAGRVEHRNSQYALYAVACRRGGLEPDLLNDAGWWRTPLWQYAAYALVIYSRAAADRRGQDIAAVVDAIAEQHGL